MVTEYGSDSYVNLLRESSMMSLSVETFSVKFGTVAMEEKQSSMYIVELQASLTVVYVWSSERNIVVGVFVGAYSDEATTMAMVIMETRSRNVKKVNFVEHISDASRNFYHHVHGGANDDQVGVFDIIHRARACSSARLSVVEIASQLPNKNSEAPSALDR
ncbi:hypothetical protein K1719_004267 [Acacia pycnantha]|nr:hypothetical protein K1719_004267 [Acacia pycnantha]